MVELTPVTSHEQCGRLISLLPSTYFKMLADTMPLKNEPIKYASTTVLCDYFFEQKRSLVDFHVSLTQYLSPAETPKGPVLRVHTVLGCDQLI
jgi:hypothetical protein